MAGCADTALVRLTNLVVLVEAAMTCWMATCSAIAAMEKLLVVSAIKTNKLLIILKFLTVISTCATEEEHLCRLSTYTFISPYCLLLRMWVFYGEGKNWCDVLSRLRLISIPAVGLGDHCRSLQTGIFCSNIHIKSLILNKILSFGHEISVCVYACTHAGIYLIHIFKKLLYILKMK